MLNNTEYFVVLRDSVAFISVHKVIVRSDQQSDLYFLFSLLSMRDQIAIVEKWQNMEAIL